MEDIMPRALTLIAVTLPLIALIPDAADLLRTFTAAKPWRPGKRRLAYSPE